MMWFVIFILIVLIFLFFEFKRMRHKLTAILIIAIVLFFYFTAPVFLPKGTNLTTISGIETGVKVYALWFASAFTNLKTVVTNAVHLEWGVDEETSNVSQESNITNSSGK